MTDWSLRAREGRGVSSEDALAHVHSKQDSDAPPDGLQWGEAEGGGTSRKRTSQSPDVKGVFGQGPSVVAVSSPPSAAAPLGGPEALAALFAAGKRIDAVGPATPQNDNQSEPPRAVAPNRGLWSEAAAPPTKTSTSYVGPLPQAVVGSLGGPSPEAQLAQLRAHAPPVAANEANSDGELDPAAKAAREADAKAALLELGGALRASLDPVEEPRASLRPLPLTAAQVSLKPAAAATPQSSVKPAALQPSVKPIASELPLNPGTLRMQDVRASVPPDDALPASLKPAEASLRPATVDPTSLKPMPVTPIRIDDAAASLPPLPIEPARTSLPARSLQPMAPPPVQMQELRTSLPAGAGEPSLSVSSMPPMHVEAVKIEDARTSIADDLRRLSSAAAANPDADLLPVAKTSAPAPAAAPAPAPVAAKSNRPSPEERRVALATNALLAFGTVTMLCSLYLVGGFIGLWPLPPSAASMMGMDPAAGATERAPRAHKSAPAPEPTGPAAAAAADPAAAAPTAEPAAAPAEPEGAKPEAAAPQPAATEPAAPEQTRADPNAVIPRGPIPKLLALGREKLRADDPVGAEAIYRRILERAPETPSATEGLVRALMDQNQTAEAVKTIERLARKRPHRLSARLLEGDAKLQAGDKAGALTAFRDALAIDPTSPEVKLRLRDQ